MRKSKEFKRMRRQAAVACRRGERDEARKLYSQAAQGYRERRDAKANKKKKKEA